LGYKQPDPLPTTNHQTKQNPKTKKPKPDWMMRVYRVRDKPTRDSAKPKAARQRGALAAFEAPPAAEAA
jgi:hypothetical protein